MESTFLLFSFRKCWIIAIFVFGGLSSSAQTDLLPPIQKWSGKSEALIVSADHPWITPCEASGMVASPDYDTTVAWLKELCHASPNLSLVYIGTSEQGRPIPMVIASHIENPSKQQLISSPLPKILVQAGIHAGEIDGKDAGMMLLRDLAFGEQRALLKGATLLFVPILNVDGHEKNSPFNRINQRGPVSMGWRTNAHNLNLNRDYTKLETAGVAAIVSVINEYNPQLYIDVHVTDGADYQYDITYGWMQTTSYSPHIQHLIKSEIAPIIDTYLLQMGHIPGPLMNAANGKDFSEGNSDFSFSPRYSHAYGDARHLPALLIENHSLKPFRQRVLGTYVLLEACMKAMAMRGPDLAEAIKMDGQQRPDSLTIEYRFGESPRDSFILLGIQSFEKKSAFTGQNYTTWTGQLDTSQIAQWRMDVPKTTISVPTAYWIGPEWKTLIDNLKDHGIVMETMDSDLTKALEFPFVESYDVAKGVYEGKVRIEINAMSTKTINANFKAGAVRIPTDQALGMLAVLLLEPMAADSYFQWGYMSSVLSQTEYTEAYAMEPFIEKMQKEDPNLAKAYDAWLQMQSKTPSPFQCYQWWYQRSPYMDASWKVIPIGREW